MLTGPFKIQRLETRPRADAVAACRGNIGRICVIVAALKRRRAVAARQAILARIDDPNALIRVRQ
jgi:hypothetical protein